MLIPLRYSELYVPWNNKVHGNTTQCPLLAGNVSFLHYEWIPHPTLAKTDLLLRILEIRKKILIFSCADNNNFEL